MDKPTPNIVVPSSTIINGWGKPKAAEPYSYNPKKARGSSSSSSSNNISFMASLISIAIYISLVYIYHISPSQLLRNPSFWWLISNTLVLIIAADYGAFASSSSPSVSVQHHHQPYDHHDDHDTYEMRRQRTIDARASVRTRFPPANIVAAAAPLPPLPPPDLVTKEQVAVTLPFPRTLTRRNSAPGGGPALRRLACNVSGDRDNNDEYSKSILRKGERRNGSESARYSCPPHDNDDVVSAGMRTSFRRSKSERGKRRVVIDESKNVVRRFEKIVDPTPPEDDEGSDHGRHEEEEEDSDDDNEYAKLSTEELNKRVEDFIQRFNTQIRLQNEACNSGELIP